MCWFILTGTLIIVLEASELMKGELAMVKIGEKIKQLRMKRELTQEKLSEILGISPQAISRWENSTTYPDINMLPSIATFFNVSVDELLGMKELRNDQEICRTHKIVHQLIEAGNICEAVSELREALKRYPNDYGFMSELALALTLYQDYSVPASNVEEAIDISERILENCTKDKIRSKVKANLCFLYLKSGNETTAVNLGKTLPHVWESRELLLPEITTQGIDVGTFREGIITTFNVIYSKVIHVTKQDKSQTSKMLMLGPADFNDISVAEKIRVIVDYLASLC